MGLNNLRNVSVNDFVLQLLCDKRLKYYVLNNIGFLMKGKLARTKSVLYAADAESPVM